MKNPKVWAEEWREVARDRPSANGATLECFIRDIQQDALGILARPGPYPDEFKGACPSCGNEEVNERTGLWICECSQ